MGVMDYATIDVTEQLANDGKVADDFDKKMFVEKAIAASDGPLAMTGSVICWK